METSTIPTDNLYKFLALGGLTSLILLGWFFQERVHDLRVERIERMGDYRILHEEINTLERDVTNHSVMLQSLRDQVEAELTIQRRLTLTNAAATELMTRTKSEEIIKRNNELETHLNAKASEFQKRADDVKMKRTELLNKQDLVDIAVSELMVFRRLAGIFLSMAAGLTGVGFWLWYVKVQVYQDRILRNEAEQRTPKNRKST